MLLAAELGAFVVSLLERTILSARRLCFYGLPFPLYG